ncbi:hypothetical protein RFI_11448 [Reticulomyxa filosa]|uniref:Uncharacterized protein n=1 Tax=Reticulomyxa filosa TaxID=46433 RepID=X6NH93_RETFI|nr:hypothetical protein RFI_11448 [Reticulomyxa filosa]|eukprot:ETO25690.1 hypothetical protein RFI_11448 [Reticulomyxa filosa]
MAKYKFNIHINAFQLHLNHIQFICIIHNVVNKSKIRITKKETFKKTHDIFRFEETCKNNYKGKNKKKYSNNKKRQLVIRKAWRNGNLLILGNYLRRFSKVQANSCTVFAPFFLYTKNTLKRNVKAGFQETAMSVQLDINNFEFNNDGSLLIETHKIAQEVMHLFAHSSANTLFFLDKLSIKLAGGMQDKPKTEKYEAEMKALVKLYGDVIKEDVLRKNLEQNNGNVSEVIDQMTAILLNQSVMLAFP